MLQRLQQSVTLLARNLVDEFVLINVGHIQYNGNKSLRQQVLHTVEHLLTAVLHKIALNTCIQLFFAQRRLQVNLQLYIFARSQSVCGKIAQRKHNRTGNTEMCKQHLTEFTAQLYAVGQKRCLHVAQR